MTPKQLLQRIQKPPLPPGFLFLGNELFYRDRCRQALARAVLGEEKGEGFIELDLSEQPLSRLADEARTLSLFASARLIVGFNAEAALPKRVADGGSAGAEVLRDYFRNPTPDVVIVIEAKRYDWSERDDKPKLERLAKFFSVVPEIVKFERLTAGEALAAARDLARRLKLSIDPGALSDLVEMLGSDMARLAGDLEKLAVFADGKKEITREDIEVLIPEARQRGMFELSDALAQKNRRRALDILDTLARAGEYWPMQINLLAGLFRQALAVKEGRARSVQEVLRLFQRHGIRIWPARAKQLLDIARQFTQSEIEQALVELFRADRDLRRERPDDRVIVEQLVMSLTA